MILNAFNTILTHYNIIDIQFFTAILLLGLLYFPKKNLKKHSKLIVWSLFILKSITFALATMLVINYLEKQWLKPVLDSAGKSEGTVAIILTFIGILLSILIAIAIFEFQRIHEYYKGKINNIIKEMQRDNQANDIRISFNHIYGRSFLKFSTLQDEESGHLIRLIPEIIPIFSKYNDPKKERVEITKAFHVLNYIHIDLLGLVDSAWEYIEKEIVPKYESDETLHKLILDVMKKC